MIQARFCFSFEVSTAITLLLSGTVVDFVQMPSADEPVFCLMTHVWKASAFLTALPCSIRARPPNHGAHAIMHCMTVARQTHPRRVLGLFNLLRYAAVAALLFFCWVCMYTLLNYCSYSYSYWYSYSYYMMYTHIHTTHAFCLYVYGLQVH